MSSEAISQEAKATVLIKAAYWSTTGIISAMMLYSAFAYFTSEQLVAAFQHLGFPDYFRVELGTAKLLGVIALLVPGVPRIKEWAYAGFGITFISAFIAHVASGDPAQLVAPPVVALALLCVSYVTRLQLRR